MNFLAYKILAGFFLAFFIFWFVLHITDRRRVLNGLAFFISIASLGLLFILLGTIQDKQFLLMLGALILVGPVILFPLVYLVGLLVLYFTGLKVIKKEGLSLSHLLSILLASGIIISSIIAPIFASRIESRAILAILGFFLTIFTYFVFGFLVFLTASFTYRLWYEKKDKDYLIVLGAGLRGDRVTPLLAGRIDKAIDFYKKQKDKGRLVPKLIMSGGQGPDEIISEAQAMKNYALEKGIAEEDILIEDKSTNTKENLEFSSQLIDKITDKSNPKVLFFTTNYHVLRASILAKSLGLDYNGIGSKTKFYYYVSAIIREYIGVVYINLEKNLIVASFIGLMSFLTYILN